MTDDNDISKMMLTKRLQYKGWKQFWYYSLALTPAIIYFVFQIGNYANKKVWLDFDLHEYLVLTALTLLIAIYKFWRLGFSKYAVEHNFKHFQSAIKITGEQLGWEYVSMDEHHFSGKLGIHHDITILRTEKLVFVNSIDKKGILAGTFDLLKSRKNLHSFTRNLASSVQGKDVVSIGRDKIVSDVIAYNKQSEWTFKNIIKRVLGYMFAGFFIFLAYIGLSEKIYLLLIPGILAVVYIILDVSVIIRKARRKEPI